MMENKEKKKEKEITLYGLTLEKEKEMRLRGVKSRGSALKTLECASKQTNKRGLCSMQWSLCTCMYIWCRKERKREKSTLNSDEDVIRDQSYELCVAQCLMRSSAQMLPRVMRFGSRSLVVEMPSADSKKERERD